MKKFIFIITAVSILLRIFSGCGDMASGQVAVVDDDDTPNTELAEEKSSARKVPPELTVVYEDTDYETILGGISWSYADENDPDIICGEETETAHPLECLEGIPNIVAGQSNYLNLKFEVEPTEYYVEYYEIVDFESDDYPDSMGIPSKDGYVEIPHADCVIIIRASYINGTEGEAEYWGGTVAYWIQISFE